MKKIFIMAITRIQPSQLYVNSAKLALILKKIDPRRLCSIAPVPIKKLNNQIIFTDGHTRALAAFLRGFKKINVFWDKDDLDWELYEQCVEWCQKEGIKTIADLRDRIISPGKYKILWLNRCEKLYRSLEKKRNSIKNR